MITKNLEILCGEVQELCLETGLYMQEEAGSIQPEQSELKGVHDFVTRVDKESERRIVTRLQSLVPDCGFITEENTLNIKGREYEWIIDPLDGTTNYIHGVPCYCISIALRHQEHIVLGVVYELNLQECFYTWQGVPSFLNGSEIKVSRTAQLCDSLIATGFPNRDYSRMKEYMELLNDLMFACHGIRRLGSAAADLAYVACGRFEAFYEYYLSPWDVAAGILLVQNAGGAVSDFSGGDNYLFGQEIIASNHHIHKELNDKLQDFFKNETY